MLHTMNFTDVYVGMYPCLDEFEASVQYSRRLGSMRGGLNGEMKWHFYFNNYSRTYKDVYNTVTEI